MNAANPGIIDLNNPIRHFGNRGIMGDDQDGFMVFAAGILQQLQDLFSGFVIQCASRFIT